jgi:purine-binding chemotaxis protein CheW
VPIEQVREITNPLPLVELPKAPHGVSGVADYRGEVVPVIDLRTRLGLATTPVTRRTKWIVIDVGDRFAALVVDAVTDVFGTAGTELRPAPTLGGGEEVRGITGVTKHDNKLVFVLDTGRFRELTAPLVESGALEGKDGPPPLPKAQVP